MKKIKASRSIVAVGRRPDGGYSFHEWPQKEHPRRLKYSVSYLDMHGRTVATALSGDSTLGLQRLKSYRDSIQTEELLNLSKLIK